MSLSFLCPWYSDIFICWLGDHSQVMESGRAVFPVSRNGSLMMPTIKILVYVCFLTRHVLGRSYGKVYSRPEALEINCQWVTGLIGKIVGNICWRELLENCSLSIPCHSDRIGKHSVLFAWGGYFLWTWPIWMSQAYAPVTDLCSGCIS